MLMYIFDIINICWQKRKTKTIFDCCVKRSWTVFQRYWGNSKQRYEKSISSLAVPSKPPTLPPALKNHYGIIYRIGCGWGIRCLPAFCCHSWSTVHVPCCLDRSESDLPAVIIDKHFEWYLPASVWAAGCQSPYYKQPLSNPSSDDGAMPSPFWLDQGSIIDKGFGVWRISKRFRRLIAWFMI